MGLRSKDIRRLPAPATDAGLDTGPSSFLVGLRICVLFFFRLPVNLLPLGDGDPATHDVKRPGFRGSIACFWHGFIGVLAGLRFGVLVHGSFGRACVGCKPSAVSRQLSAVRG